MTTTISLIFLIILISVVYLSESKEKNKRIAKLERDWRFCKELLNNTKSVLTEEQKKEVEENIVKSSIIKQIETESESVKHEK